MFLLSAVNFLGILFCCLLNAVGTKILCYKERPARKSLHQLCTVHLCVANYRKTGFGYALVGVVGRNGILLLIIELVSGKLKSEDYQPIGLLHFLTLRNVLSMAENPHLK